MNVALFIEELLWEHDCVVVPGWGGFIANYQSAKKNPITHEIFPPSRQLGFNKHLIQQDGLLQSYIAQKLFISITEAQHLLQNWVKEQQQKVANGEKVWLPKLGVIAQDIHGQLQFIPDENSTFLKSSFGLPSIQLQVTQPHKLIQPSDQAKHSETKKWLVAAGIALTIGLGVFATQQSLKHTDTAGWSWGTAVNSSSYQAETPTLPNIESTFPSPENLRALVNQEFSENTLSAPASASTPPSSQKKEIERKKESSLVIKNKSNTWVVGGVFVIKDNAEKKVAMIKALGFPKAKVIVFQDRYYACYGEVHEEQEEINLRKKVALVDPFAWTKR